MRCTRRRTCGARGSVESRSTAPSLVMPAKPPLRVTSTTRPGAGPGVGCTDGRAADADGVPGVLDGGGVLARRRDGGRREGGEVAVGGQAGGERGVPDPAGAAPRLPADGPGGQHEGAVGDAAVQVHAAVVVGGHHEVRHRPDLGVLADLRVVVRRAGVRHRPQRPTVDAGQEDPLPDQPVGGRSVLAEVALLDARPEDVRHRLVQRPGLALVDEVGGELGDRVGQLVAQHVDRLGEPPEDLAVPVAEHQLGAVPEGVVVVLLVVHRRHDGRAPVVVGVAAVVGEQRQRLGDPGGRLVDGHVADLGLAGRADQPPGSAEPFSASWTSHAVPVASGATAVCDLDPLVDGRRAPPALCGRLVRRCARCSSRYPGMK